VIGGERNQGRNAPTVPRVREEAWDNREWKNGADGIGTILHISHPVYIGTNSHTNATAASRRKQKELLHFSKIVQRERKPKNCKKKVLMDVGNEKGSAAMSRAICSEQNRQAEIT